MRAHSMRLPPFARRSTMGTTDRSKKRSRRCAARPRSDEITTRLSCSFNFLAIRAPLAALEPAILALANRIQGFAQMADDMELIEQNRRLRRMRIRRQSKRLPHVHDRQANARTLLLAEPGVELAHARLRPVLAAKPD